MVRHRRSRKTRAEASARPPLPNWQALLTPVIAHTFADLRVGVSLWIGETFWQPINIAKHVISTEGELGVEARRWAYNRRCLARVQREHRSVTGEHSGFFDLFVPVFDGREVRAILAAGPLARARPTSADVLHRWFQMSHAQGRLADASFADYVSLTLGTLTLEGALFEAFERLVQCFACLVEGRGAPEALAKEAETLRAKLSEARSAELSWDAARSMVGERSARLWSTHDLVEPLRALGMRGVPGHVAVGLISGQGDEYDPLDGLLRRDAFQRACVALAQERGDVVCGQVGDHGVMFLLHEAGAAARARARLIDLCGRAATLARRFGFGLHSGIDHASSDAGLAAQFRAALWAAEKALSRGQSVVFGEPHPAPSSQQLRDLRRKLTESVAEESTLLSPRFDGYIDAVLAHSGGRLESTRAHLAAALERLSEPLLARGALDPKSFDDLMGTLERRIEDAPTVMRLVALYRSAVADIDGAMQRPTAARQGRGTRRGQLFVQEHLSERLTLARVARAAGFAPDYFSRLFKRQEGVTLERYTQDLRVSRAKHMLTGTTLSLEGIRALCGFTSRNYFHRVFKKSVGMTPLEYRHGDEPR